MIESCLNPYPLPLAMAVSQDSFAERKDDIPFQWWRWSFSKIKIVLK